MNSLTFALMGFVSLLLQVALLRELLTVFSGNELVMGITLSLWLIFVGLGSLAGGRLRAHWAFGGSFLLVALLSGPSVFGAGLIRPLISLSGWETVPLGATFASTAVLLFPLCFALGLQFPLAVRHASGKGGPAATVYGLEAAGAFGAGLIFTFLVSGRLDSASIAFALGALSVLAACLVLDRKAPALALLPVALFYFGSRSLEPSLWRAGHTGELQEKVRSRYGEIWVIKLKEERSLYSSGRLLFTYPEPQTEELRAHLPLTMHPAPASVLVVGGSPAALREFLKYPLKRMDFVEIDPELVKTSLRLLSPEDLRAVRDERAKIITEDGRKYIKSIGGPSYDLIVLSLPAPSTANLNRFYTREFFMEARAALREGGLLALSLPSSSGYVGRRMRLSNGSVYSSLRSVFPFVEVSTEEYGGIYASEGPIETDPERLSERFALRGVETAYFHRYILSDAFMPMRAALYKERLSAVSALNTDMRPASYLYNLMLWAEMHGGGLLNRALALKGRVALALIAALGAGAVLLRRKKTPTLYYSMLTTGYAGMSVFVCIMLGYQSALGFVYERVGLLSALFMGGMAAGTYLQRRTDKRGLMLIELLWAAFAFGAYLLFRGEAFFYLLGLTAGALTGGAFKAVSAIRQDRAAGGRLYALDLIGSFAGAFLTTLFFVPLLGIKSSLFIAAAIKSLSAASVFLMKDA